MNNMSTIPQKVIIVFDPEFGDRVIELARTAHVWVIDSPKNKLAAEHYMEEIRKKGSPLDERGVTLTICYRSKLDSDFLETLEDHHGMYAQNLPWNEIEVIGASLDEQTEKLLKNCGFYWFERTSWGFKARR